VTVFSGWELEGVDYDTTNILARDEIDFLNSAWDALIPIIKWGIDAFQKLINSLTGILRVMVEEGTNLAELVAEVFGTYGKALKTAFTNESLNFVSSVIDIAESVGIGEVGPFSAYGFTFLITRNDEEVIIGLYQDDGSYSFKYTINRSDISLTGDISFWCVDLDLEMHPLYDPLGGDEWLDVTGLLDFTGEEFEEMLNYGFFLNYDALEIDIRGPVYEQEPSVGMQICEVSIESVIEEKIIIPFQSGVLLLADFGMRIAVDNNVLDSIKEFVSMIVDDFRSILEGMDHEMSIEGFITTIEQLTLEILDTINEMNDQMNKISSLELFFELGLSEAPIKEEGMEVSFRAGSEFVDTLLRWFVNNAVNLIYNILSNYCSFIRGTPLDSLDDYLSIPEAVWEDFSIEVGMLIESTKSASKFDIDTDAAAVALVNIPFLVGSYIPQNIKNHVGDSYAECGIAITTDVNSEWVANCNLYTKVWYVKLKISE
jgi:hypothetical protein